MFINLSRSGAKEHFIIC